MWYYKCVAITSSAAKFRLEKIDGSTNFGLWNFQVKDMLVQVGLLHEVFISTCTLISTNARCAVNLCHLLKTVAEHCMG